MTGVYCCMCLVLVLVFRRAALPTSKTRARATMAIVNISHRSQFLEYSHEEYWVSLLMILSTVILIPPNLRLIANPFAFNSLAKAAGRCAYHVCFNHLAFLRNKIQLPIQFTRPFGALHPSNRYSFMAESRI